LVAASLGRTNVTADYNSAPPRAPSLEYTTKRSKTSRSPALYAVTKVTADYNSAPPRAPSLEYTTKRSKTSRSNRVAALFEIISSRETSESGDTKHLAADPRTILGRETPVRVRDPEHGGVPVLNSRREYYTSKRVRE
jgi:hypothetical protein